MRLILVPLFLFFSSLYADAAFEQKIIDLIFKEINRSVIINKVEDLSSNKDFKIVVIEVDNIKAPIIASAKADMIITNVNSIIFANKSDSEDLNKVMLDIENSKSAAIKSLMESLNSKEYISLTSSKKNAPTMYILMDANCGYCKEEFRDIKTKLKDSNVNIVIVGILGESSKKKGAWALLNIPSTATNDKKIDKINEMFSSSLKVPDNINVDDISATTDKLFKDNLINGVPFIYPGHS